MSTHLRLAASVCVLSTGLLISGPSLAVASADSDSSAGGHTSNGRTNDGDGAGGSKPSAGLHRGPNGSATDAVRSALHSTAQNAIQGVTSTLSAIVNTGQQQLSSIASSPRTTFGGTPTVYGSLVENSPTPTADDPAPEQTGSKPKTPVPIAPSPAQPAAAVQPNVVQPVSDVITSLTSTVQYTVQSAVASTPALLASPPTVTAPVTDVITSVQDLLTSVTTVGTSLLQASTDLSSFFADAAMAPTKPVAGSITDASDGNGSPTAAVPLPALGVPTPPASVTVVAAPVISEMVQPATSVGLTATGTIRSATTAVLPLFSPPGAGASVLSIVEHVIGAVVATVSVAALLAMALPGIGGLLGVSAAGMRIGYRQAKAGSALPSTAIARFVASGPVGVVRSGSQVAVHRSTAGPSARRATHSRVVESADVASIGLLDRTG